MDSMAAMLNKKRENLCKSLYTLGLIRRNMIFNFAPLSAARFCKASMDGDTKSQNLTSENNIGSSEGLGDNKLKTGISLLLLVSVSVSLNTSSSIQFDSKKAEKMKHFRSSVWGISHASNLSKRVSRSCYLRFGKTCLPRLLRASCK